STAPLQSAFCTALRRRLAATGARDELGRGLRPADSPRIAGRRRRTLPRTALYQAGRRTGIGRLAATDRRRPGVAADRSGLVVRRDGRRPPAGADDRAAWGAGRLLVEDRIRAGRVVHAASIRRAASRDRRGWGI